MAVGLSKPEQNDLNQKVRLTHLGLWAERLCAALWPLYGLGLSVFAFFLMGLHSLLALELVWAVLALAGLAAVFGLWYAQRHFQRPRAEDALARVDARLEGQPLRALRDEQVIGKGDSASEAVWAEYQRRMLARVRQARAVGPVVRLAAADPIGLRHLAMLAAVVALLFGAPGRLLTLGETFGAAPAGSTALAGPSWEGWIEPPAYTGRPALYLNEIPAGALTVPQDSVVTLRLYGAAGALTVSETLSAQLGTAASQAAAAQSFAVTRSGALDISGPGGRAWQITMQADHPPLVEPMGPAETAAGGLFTMPFEALDDYGVRGGDVLIELDLAALERRYGLALAPEPRAPLTLPLPLPVAGARDDFEETLLEDFSRDVWANLPVLITLTAQDAKGQSGSSGPFEARLVARKFFNPLAAAVVELRRDLLWNRENGPRVAQLLRAISHAPDGLFKRETDYLRLRVVLRRLETRLALDGMDDATVAELAEALWQLALNLEDGSLSDALERMRDAQDKLSQALRNGASDAEIAELMQELREATQDYMRQLAQQQPQDPQDGEPGERGESLQLSQQDLQDMMDRIQELMEQGRMAEAEQALREFQEMMENMRVTQNQSGQGEGQQAMEGLAETLREQQGLSDQAFRDLQEQFNPNARAGESGENEGRNGGEGRGEQHEGQGEGRADAGQNGAGEDEGQGQGGAQERSLAERQQALRDELSRQAEGLPQMGGAAGEAAREALDNAGRAMAQAEEALRQNELAEALDRQAEAMENLREGMDNLGEALAQAREGQEGQSGQNAETAGRESSDPLGRNRRGFSADGEEMLGEDDVYRRARELLDEIRRRTGEASRSPTERSYLERLLDRF
ncbi:TIGR02302 family protein [uncultured Lentibacter sp.]|uniref:TIGR02302 family protein n=1 Tax=uncultured Lentibacter sp. TaxID=1659309 RepID=UPI00260235B4|nr:TIGR02302 family protein [uncultured Lentibacter sp.]